MLLCAGRRRMNPSGFRREKSFWTQVCGVRLLLASPQKARVGFTSSYFAHPAEIRPLMKRNGFEDLDLIGCEGAISMIEETINELKGDECDSWVDLNYRLGTDLSLQGAAEPLLYVDRKYLK